MKILDRYIIRHVVIGSLMALVVLVGLDLVFAFFAEAPDIGTGNYDIFKSLLYVMLTAPRRAYDFLPMAAIVGSMVMLGSLAGNSEFVVMRSAGVSVAQIIRSILKGGLILIFLALVLGEGVAPFTEPYAQEMRSFARSQTTALKSEHGIWARDGNNFVNIARVRPGGELQGLDIYEFDDRFKLRVSTHAERALFEGNQWQLYDIKQVRHLDDALEIENYAFAQWDALLNPELLSVLAVKPEQLPIWRLTTYMDYLRINGLDVEPYEFAIWRKVTAPFAILVMLFLSVPFLFSALRSSSMGQRILVGIVLGIGYFLISHISGRLGEVYDLNAMLSNVAPVLFFLAAGFAGLYVLKQ